MKKKSYPIIDIPASGFKTWYGGAYSFVFVYSKYNGNFILRGYIKEVEEYLKKHYTHYFCNKVLFGNGNHRNIWSFWKEGVGILQPTYISKNYKYNRDKFKIHQYRQINSEPISYSFKRIPKRWIPEFDKF